MKDILRIILAIAFLPYAQLVADEEASAAATNNDEAVVEDEVEVDEDSSDDGGLLDNLSVGQIAGALARRIVNYAEVGNSAEQGNDAGFIKFGSRVDLFLPIGTKLDVKLNQVVKGGITVLASKD